MKLSKLVNEINAIIKSEKTEELGWKYMGVNLIMKAESMDKESDIEDAFKNYILENDCWESKEDHSKQYCTAIEKLDQYKIENIKYWIDDLRILIGLSVMKHVVEDEKKVYRLIKIMQENKVKAYRLVDSKINNECYLCDYSYSEGFVGGHIRCYETDTERFIISFLFCD